MKITIPALALELGGGTRALVRIGQGLTDRGHEVTLLVPEGAPVHWEVPIPLQRVPEITAAAFSPTDIILANFWPTVQPAYESGAGKVVRLSLGYEPLWVTDAEAARNTYRLPLPTLAISQWQADLIANETGCPTTVIPLGIEPLFKPPTANTNRQGLLYLWRHRTQGYTFKGAGDLVRALGTIYRHVPQLHLRIVTPVPIPPELPYDAEVIVAPTDAELATLYQQAAVFVSTSWFEAFSMAPLEAMACGAPVVTTDCGGVREYARHGDNCLLVPPRSATALAAAIVQSLQDRTLAKRLGTAGTQTALAWTWDRTTSHIEAALLQAVQE